MINSDEINEKVANWRTRAGLWLKAFGGMYVALWKFTVPVTLIIIAGLFVAWLTWHSTSILERQAEDGRTNTTLSDANTNVIANQLENNRERVDDAETASDAARKQREKAKQANTSNTNYSRANQERCFTFPESQECQQK